MQTPSVQNEHDGSFAFELDALLAETYWRVAHKISDSPAFAPWKFLYLLVEEIGLLFEALVVRISLNPAVPLNGEIPQSHATDDMNVSPEDYQSLQKAFSPKLVHRCLVDNSVVYHRSQAPIETRNYTLRFIDSVLILPIRSRVGATPVATVEIYYADDGRDIEGRSNVVAAFLREIPASSPIQGRLLSLLSDLVAHAIDGAEFEAIDTKSLPPRSVRDSKLDFLGKWQVDDQPISTEFQGAYRHYFEPLDAVFGSLHDRFIELPDFYFSYRRSNDDHLSFFPTAQQVGDLLKAGMTIGEFKHLWTYPYRKGGLNGYVLRTAHSIYLPNQHLDSRFADLPPEDHRNDSAITYDVEIQKALLPRLFKSQPEPLYTYTGAHK